MNTSTITSSETNPAKRRFRKLRFALIAFAAFALTVAIFYGEENWRGRRAWENCKREYEAKGYVVDWDKLIPPPVPDDQNFFKAPNMSEWFVRGFVPNKHTATNELAEHLSPASLSRFTTNNPVVLAEWTWQPLLTAKNIAAANSENADLVLKYTSFPSRPHIFTEANVPVASDENPDTNTPVVVIQFQDLPITAAIENLARQAGINYLLDPKIGYNQPGKNGQIKSEPTLSIRWNNITARAALLALLDNFGLQLIENPNAGLARITLKNSDAPQIYASPDLDGKIKHLLQNVIGTNIIGVRGDRLLVKSPAEIKPARIILLSGMKPDQEIIAWFRQCFPTNAVGDSLPRIHIEPPTGTIPFPKTFRVILDSAYSTADYLAWSDQLQPDFDQIRDALKRPYARIDCDYSNPSETEIPNYIVMRSMAQTLAQRAQCHFLLNQPEQALDDLTRIHEMRLILEGAPTHKPMTLVAAMINVAIAGLYADTVAEGMRRHLWQEPQLAALQKQLAEKDLTPFVSDALKTESVAVCRDFQIISPNKIFDWNATNSSKLWRLWPRGWTYQNMANIFIQETRAIGGFNSTDNTVSPRYCEEAARNVDKFVAGSRWSPYKLLAAVGIPNFVRAWQTTAHNQTMVNEAQIACALERYKLANGNYPETLDALAPQFMEKIPHDIIGGQPLHYRRTDDGKFLLYSVGWNETDDGGVDLSQKSKFDFSQGDWVWKN